MKLTKAAIVAMLALPAFAQTPAKTLAQQLVDQALARHPEVVVMAMHVTPPNQKDNVIVASNIGRIGKKADEDDMRVINTGKSNLEVNPKGDRFEVELVLQDKTGKTVGALGVVFPYKPGDDKGTFDKKAQQIRNEMREQIPTLAALFQPAH
jgi:hypothetical protein